MPVKVEFVYLRVTREYNVDPAWTFAMFKEKLKVCVCEFCARQMLHCPNGVLFDCWGGVLRGVRDLCALQSTVLICAAVVFLDDESFQKLNVPPGTGAGAAVKTRAQQLGPFSLCRVAQCFNATPTRCRTTPRSFLLRLMAPLEGHRRPRASASMQCSNWAARCWTSNGTWTSRTLRSRT